ncbi:MAG: O-antigen ligase family protein [Actinobacteria bacterium]|nr:O-antigen ligase family protein [Actinomycetota bacterium]
MAGTRDVRLSTSLGSIGCALGSPSEQASTRCVAIRRALGAARLGLLAGVVTIPIIAFNPSDGFDGFYGVKAQAVLLLGALMAAWWACALLTRTITLTRLSPILVVGLGLTGWLTLSTLVSVDPSGAVWGSALRHDGLLVWFAGLVVMATAMTMSDERSWRTVGDAAALTCVGVSAYAVLQHFGLDFSGLSTSLTYARSSGTFHNPVVLGGYLTLMMPILVIRAVRSDGRAAALLWTAGVGVTLAATYFTFSRAAWIGSLGGLLLLVGLLLWTRSSRYRRLIGVIAVAALLAIAVSLVPRGDRVVVEPHSLAKDAASAVSISDARNAGRLATWAIALAIIRDRPWFGTGPDQMGAVFESYRTPQFDEGEGPAVVADKAHSEPLNLAVTLGIPGALLCFLLLCVVGREPARQSLRRALGPESVAVMCGLAGYLAASLVSITVPGVHTIFFLLLGMLARPREGR